MPEYVFVSARGKYTLIWNHFPPHLSNLARQKKSTMRNFSGIEWSLLLICSSWKRKTSIDTMLVLSHWRDMRQLYRHRSRQYLKTSSILSFLPIIVSEFGIGLKSVGLTAQALSVKLRCHRGAVTSQNGHTQCGRLRQTQGSSPMKHLLNDNPADDGDSIRKSIHEIT